MEAFDNVVKQYTPWLDNPYIAGALTVFLVVYAGAAAPKLPEHIVKLFDYTLVKILMFFLIVFVSRRNATVALVAAIALMVSIMTLNRLKFDKEMMAMVKNEEKESKKILLETCSCTCNCLNELIPITDDGKLIVSEAQNAVAKGALHPAKAEELAQNIIVAEGKGQPILIAKTEEGAKRMEEIARGVDAGKISEEEGKKMSATVVVVEAVMEAKDKSLPKTIKAQDVKSVSSSESMAEMAQEVLKRKQEETQKRGGVPLSSDELKNLCASVLDERKKSTGTCKGNDCNDSEYDDIQGVDDMSSNYESVSH